MLEEEPLEVGKTVREPVRRLAAHTGLENRKVEFGKSWVVGIGHNTIDRKEVDHMVVSSMRCVEEVGHIPHLEEIGIEDTRLADQGRVNIYFDSQRRLCLMGWATEDASPEEQWRIQDSSGDWKQLHKEAELAQLNNNFEKQGQ